MAKQTQLGYRDIESRLEQLKHQHVAAEDVGYRLLYAFGKSEKDISRYKEGKGVLKTFDGLLIKGLLGYKAARTLALTTTLEQLKADPQVLKAAPKIICVSDGETILAYDRRERDSYENPVNRLYCDFAFFYPLADVERVHNVEESPADVKAAEKLAKLHDELRAYNEFSTDSDLHDLNIFISRLLFCFFAEDTGIFEPNLFSNSIKQYTKADGSDLSDYLHEAFHIMDVRQEERGTDVPDIIRQFPYVNGGLFARDIQIPCMSMKARKIVVECGDLNWQDINPDIFGSMIQAVVNPDVRANQGMHYTSVPNIMKVINPLFLDELRAEYDAIAADAKALKQNLNLGMLRKDQYEKEYKDIEKRCNKLLRRMMNMKFFDPACGSGNFLIITYKALRLLEMDILGIIRDYNPQGGMFTFMDGSVISISQFYGIELLDFPHEVAMLSLWLAEHQMNKKLNEGFGINTRALPLHNITQIVCGNACRLDWNVVCPHERDDEVFVFGNPPYLGYSKQTLEQKQDVLIVCPNNQSIKKVDYIGCWFIKAARFISHSNSMFAFVTTNSITQGEQVALLWPIVLKDNDILFAYKSFAWRNNAKNNAMVAVTIIGLKSKSRQKEKRIFTESNIKVVNNINPYIIDYETLYVVPSNVSLSSMPEMIKGSSPVDDGNLILSAEEKACLIEECPSIAKYIKKYVGADEFVNGKVRYCLYFEENTTMLDALCENCPSLKERKNKIIDFRKRSSKVSTREWAEKPLVFIENKYKKQSSIVIPQTGSERRKYLPLGIADSDTVLSNAVRLIYTGDDCDMYLYGVLCSLLHMVWVRTVAGRMKTDMQYSNTICYNTFPFPKISSSKKQEIEDAATDILLTREPYLTKGSTLADLYDPDKMPQDLKEAHERLDDIVESCYPDYPFASDEARLECLFKMYEKMTKK